VSGGQVEAIVAHLSPATTERFAAQESEIVPVLVALSVDDTVRPWTTGRPGRRRVITSGRSAILD